MKEETYRTRFRLNSTSSTGRGMNCVRSASSVSLILQAGYDVLMVTAAIFTLIYQRRRKKKERKGWIPKREEIDE
jgi:hypothetical protein